MFKINSIKINNFKSFKGETIYEFSQNKSVLIKAINKDDDGADSNGSGKSNLIKAISFGFLGIHDRSESLERFINNSEKSASVELNLSCKSDKIRILRTIHRSKSKGSTVELFFNNELDTDITNEKEGTKKLIEYLGIHDDDLLNYFIINQENSNNFLSKSDSQQKAIISRFTNLESVDCVINFTKEEITNLKRQKQILTTKNQTLESNLTFFTEQMSCEEETWKQEQLKQINTIIGEIEENKNEVTEIQNQEFQIRREISKIEIEDTKELLEILKQIEQNILEKNTKRTQIRKNLYSIESEIETHKSKLLTFISCPKCGTGFSLSTNLSDDELKFEIESRKKEIQKIKNEINTFIEKINEDEESKNFVFSEIRKQDSNKLFLKQNQEQLQRIEKRKENANKNISRLSEKLKLKELEKFKKNFNFSKEKENINRSLIENTEQISSIDLKLEELKFWEWNFGLNGFKTFLINKVLCSIEGYINLFLKKFNTNLTLEIRGYKILSSGEIRDKITIFVSQNGEEPEPFTSLSGGQKCRVNICCILALQKLINNSTKNGGLDFLLLDETFEGLDVTGQSAVIEILQESGVTNMVVSHNNNDIACDKIIIIKENGESKIQKEHQF